MTSTPPRPPLPEKPAAQDLIAGYRAAAGIAGDRLPRHVAIIMDGNGRWAGQRGQPRIAGHRAGARRVREIVTECARLGLDALTLYSFSIENWKRPAEEVGALMQLCVEHLNSQLPTLLENDVRLVQLGRRDGLPAEVVQRFKEVERATARCQGLTLALALNYGSRTEITDAVRTIAEKVRDGELVPASITEATVSEHLYTAGLPDPDLLIRTSGEMRLSNYLLWQISYAELHVTDVHWPDFTAEHLHEALRDYAGRDRRYGGLSE